MIAMIRVMPIMKIMMIEVMLITMYNHCMLYDNSD